MSALPIVIVGAGSIGMRHVEVAQACPLTQIAAVVEPVEARRAELAQQGLNAVADLTEVRVQNCAAIIATPTQDHHTSALACFERGWPVLVEKPTAGTLDQANDVLRCASQKGLPLVTGHHRRCHPNVQEARAAAQEIGQLVGVQGLWSLRKHDAYYDAAWRRMAGAGPLLTNLSHEIDLMRFILGDIAEVTAQSSNACRGLEVEDTCAMAFRFEGGALGSFLISDAGASPWSFEAATGENPAIAASGQDYLRIVGTQGTLEFPSLARWGRSGPGEIEWSKPLLRRDGEVREKVDPLLVQIALFAEMIARGSDEDEILCTGDQGVKALEMTLATALSAREGRPVKAGGVPGDYTGA